MVEYVVSRFFSSCLVSLSQTHTHTKHNTRVTSPLCANSFSELCCSFLLLSYTQGIYPHTKVCGCFFFKIFSLAVDKMVPNIEFLVLYTQTTTTHLDQTTTTNNNNVEKKIRSCAKTNDTTLGSTYYYCKKTQNIIIYII